jgi:hypothetical protein
MLYTNYGKTNIKLSVISCGGMRFSNPTDIDKNAAVVKAAYDAGINYFDTAPYYCDDKSEDIFGAALKTMLKTRKEKPFYISTKSGKFEPQEVRENFENSLRRLGVDCIDFYHFWCISSLDDYNNRKKKGALGEFIRLKEEGLIKHLCVSTHMTGTDIGKMLEDYPFEGVLLGYCAMNFAYRDAGLDTAAKMGKGVVVMNPLGGGLIPQYPERFNFVKSREDETVVEGALRFLINDKRITTSLIGFNNEKEIKDAVKAVDGFKPISDKKISEIRDGIKQNFNELCTSCQYCDKCPKGIPVPKLMEAYNHYMLSGKPIDMMERLKWHWGIEADSEYLRMCNECGTCEKACTQKLPIRKRLKDILEHAEKAKKTH